MILDQVLFGDKSKIMTDGPVPEEPETHERGFLAASLAEGGGIVGVAGFEPTAPRSQSECATKLRHTPGANGVSLRAGCEFHSVPSRSQCRAGPRTSAHCARPEPGPVLSWAHRGRSSMAESQSSKLKVRVRFPSPAPR